MHSASIFLECCALRMLKLKSPVIMISFMDVSVAK